MRLSSERFEFYQNYFKDKSISNIFVYLDDIAAISNKGVMTIKKELRIYLADKKEYELIEGRRNFYNQHFFSLDYKNRSTIEELASLLSIPVDEVKRDLNYLGLKGGEYKKVSQYREVLEHGESYKAYLEQTENVPTYKQMSEKMGIPNYQIKKEMDICGIEKGVYLSPWDIERKKKVKDYFEGIKDGDVLLSLTAIATLLKTCRNTLRKDMRELGIYEDYCSRYKKYLMDAKVEREKLRLEIVKENRPNIKKNRINTRYLYYLKEAKDGVLLKSRKELCDTLSISLQTLLRDMSNLGLVTLDARRMPNINRESREKYYLKYMKNNVLQVSACFCAKELNVSPPTVLNDWKILGIKNKYMVMKSKKD